jgi:hypothetical protein
MNMQLDPIERYPSVSTPDAAAWLPAVDPSSTLVRPDDDPAIARDDPLWRLSRFPRQALVHKLHVHSAEQLLTLPDRQVLKAVESSERCGPRGIAEVRCWLSEQRLANVEPVHTPIEAKARADDVLTLARHRIADGIRSAIRDQKLDPMELARRCGTSRDTVQTVIAGDAPGTIELALRMAAALGIAMRVEVG